MYVSIKQIKYAQEQKYNNAYYVIILYYFHICILTIITLCLRISWIESVYVN